MSQQWTPETMGRKGGERTSKAKTEAARLNWVKALKALERKRNVKVTSQSS